MRGQLPTHVLREPRTIEVRGAREHNLKNISVRVPRGKLVCLTGVSGSGKSSFAFDTLFAEGQRRYLESLSAYTRQFLGQMNRPAVDFIGGLSPAIAIQQKSGGWNPRSTVGTITQIHDYLRIMFARLGRQHCPRCDAPIEGQTRERMLLRIMTTFPDAPIYILAPIVRGQKGEYRELFEDLIRQGFARARVDGVVHALADPPTLARHGRHDIEVVIDRLIVETRARSRLAEGVETALKLGGGLLIVQRADDRNDRDGPGRPSAARSRAKHRSDQEGRPSRARSGGGEDDGGRNHEPPGELLLSAAAMCPNCGISFEPPSPQLFSFNSPSGACPGCDGLGSTFDFDPELLVPDPNRTFLQGAVVPMGRRIGRWRRHIYRGVALHAGFKLDTPWRKLSSRARNVLLFGLGETHVTYEWRWSRGVWRHGGTFAGVVSDLREKYGKAQSPMIRSYYEKFMRRAVCPECHGGRLKVQARSVRFGGVNLVDLCRRQVGEVINFFELLSLTPTQEIIAADLLREVRGRLQFLVDVGLGYLTLDRAAPSLSGGESQRIRLASQIGAGLVGVLYVLDEPSIGLHPRDNERLLKSLLKLRDQGNTVIVVEHDEQTMRVADEIIDFGPGPGVLGGEVVAQGTPYTVSRSRRSVTGRFLRGTERIEVPANRRPVPSRSEKTRRHRSKTMESKSGKE